MIYLHSLNFKQMPQFSCQICPFQCKVDRINKFGVCKLPNKLLISHYQLHFWEEPMISGQNGSGAIFFTGCNSNCVFCQNYEISCPQYWSKNIDKFYIDEERLMHIINELIAKKVHNINFVTPTPYSEILIEFLKKNKKNIKVPIVWNSNAYEKVETIKKLKGLIDIYIPDLKYIDNYTSLRYSKLPNYFKYADPTIKEMFTQVGFPVINDQGIMQKGLIIRHLVLPANIEESKKILNWIHENFGSQTYISLMSQYYPTFKSSNFPEINRPLSKQEHEEITNYFLFLDFEDGLIQDPTSADSKYTPQWER